MSTLNKEQKIEMFTQFGGSPKNTGSTEGQVAMLTQRINDISLHLKTNKQDHHSTRSLLKMVGQRKSLLKYLASKDLNGYRSLIEKLGLRK